MSELRVLLVEDSETDAILILRELQKAGYSPALRRVETREDMTSALNHEAWDVILCDHALPQFNSAQALSLVRTLAHNLPFIIVSGHIGEDAAVAAMKSGADDYVMKSNLKRLVPVLEREIRDAKERVERKRAEEELRKKEEELLVAKRVEAMKDEFIGMVSHELKNPLTVITGALMVAMDERLPRSEANGLIRDALESAASLTVIIENLLELSRSQNQHLQLKREPYSIAKIAQAVVQQLRTKSVRHQIVIDIPADLPDVPMDPVRIERVLYNLIDNAIKYSPEGGQVRVSAGLQEDMVISVADQGIGISAQDKQRLFKHFERIEKHGSQKIDGIGLGLKVCQILVEAHQGKIRVESEEGKGSTFLFNLPLK